MAGQPGIFASRAEYDAFVQTLARTGSIEDATKIYWDVRLPERYPTIEFRVADVCMTVDETVMVAGLVRALVRAFYEQALRDQPYPAARPELLRAAHWRAARYGLDGDLIDIAAERSVPAHELIEGLLLFVRPVLEDLGEWDEVAALVHDTLRRGNGAARQRAAYRRAGRLEDVVDLIVAETARGTGSGG
jgi:carboxylate-amine ligase